ncbi:unnamed protein product [Acanthoscelides obtectus]|uniref:Endonuclease/exonuclease/phosphatase domain-containing protein n=1 Tax=Acanthoscelides obtectus TaxID=200917 RepID=A0A9P0KTU6_ACAOB|nr:unnamed protein product [Acanthoscelides obtectus]CAK1646454.1 hypothetical protein AOBTE_LOCUS14643 [Acanthoscelides obtectus]
MTSPRSPHISAAELEKRRLATTTRISLPFRLVGAQIRSSLEYCLHVWSAATPTTLFMVDAVRRRAFSSMMPPRDVPARTVPTEASPSSTNLKQLLQVVLLGDFNARDELWSGSNKTDAAGRADEAFAITQGLTQLISVVIDGFSSSSLNVNADWCRQRSFWDQEWNSIVFSDEFRFCLGMHDGRARVRRRRGERRNPQFFVERHGAIAYGSRSPLIFIRVLEPHLLPYLDTLADPTFQQDNARPHVARHVWDMIGRRLLNLQRPPQTLEALREELVVAWNEIPQEDIDHLIRSMPRRVGECVAHQDASTHH